MNTKPASMSFSVFFVHAVFQWVCCVVWRVGCREGLVLRVLVGGLVLLFTFVSVPERVCVGGYPKITWEAGKGSVFLIMMGVQMVGNVYGVFKNKIQE
jgi:hypothetical protein